jgi:prepilin-type N-terminal cleavage/methylation domain-containing protein
MIVGQLMNKNSGFGLIELLAALGVLAVILAVTLPNFLGRRSFSG